MSPEVALLRHHEASTARLLLGLKRSCRKHRLRSEFDPMYGPAVRCKRFPRSGECGLASMYPVSDWSLSWLPTIMDISARASSLAVRPHRAIRVTSVRTRREDRSSISSHPLADLGG